jgi:hypothetical protein
LADDIFLEKLRRDMLEQFKDKPNIAVYQKALARQLDALHEFFIELDTLRWLQTAAGAQLDGIGDIVVLSRREALAVANMADKNIPMDDETYRLYLAWKIALNTSNCTHSDRHSALKLFWDLTPLYYSEDPAYPATIFITVPEVILSSEEAIFKIAGMIKAAGVALFFVFPADSFSVGDYDGGAIRDVIEDRFEGDVIGTKAATYHGAVTSELIKEVFIAND